jgi:hypothetical protein
MIRLVKLLALTAYLIFPKLSILEPSQKAFLESFFKEIRHDIVLKL